MKRAKVAGLALAIIEEGQITRVATYGDRGTGGLPLASDTVMYSASLTKTVFAYFVMQLVDEGRLDLDAPIAGLLPKPLPEYARYADLGGDTRWQRLTPRHVLTHATGFANFALFEPDQRLRFHFEPGSRYAYSGEGFNLLQFTLEQGLGIDVGLAMQQRIVDRFGMARTSMSWREDFASNIADGFTIEGRATRHSHRRNVRASGSMDTTISDQARFWAAAIRGDGLSPAARAEWVRPLLPIRSAHQFPTLTSTSDPRAEQIRLAAANGVVVFRDLTGGSGWYKGGHDDDTANVAVCLEHGRRCVVLLSNDVRAESIFPEIVRRTLGRTSVPWWWEYRPSLGDSRDTQESVRYNLDIQG